MSFEEIVSDFPDITLEDIRACLRLLRSVSADFSILLPHEVASRP
jgi:uncharacterized protein (DUF433 family)